MATSTALPAYFELSWSILSTIGLVNVCIGLMVAGIAGFSVISAVPIIVSAAGALANGMCYYAFYADYPVANTAAASAVADLAWLVQEAGLSFYSYGILNRVLRNRERTAFLLIFWTLMVCISSVRITILVTRVRFILGSASADLSLQSTIDNLHVGYFACIAVVECASAVFLLRKFNEARTISVKAALRVGLFSYLMRSTEIRLALLALIGVTRAVTYSFQNTAQSAQGVAGQLDRFAYSLECLFPIVMFIDILASRLVFANENGLSGSQSHSRSQSHGKNHHSSYARGRIPASHVRPNDSVFDGSGEVPGAYPMPAVSRHIEVKGGAVRSTVKSDQASSSSQEFIIEPRTVSAANNRRDEEQVASYVSSTKPIKGQRGSGGVGGVLGGTGINKTVEFEVFQGERR